MHEWYTVNMSVSKNIFDAVYFSSSILQALWCGSIYSIHNYLNGMRVHVRCEKTPHMKG